MYLLCAIVSARTDVCFQLTAGSGQQSRGASRAAPALPCASLSIGQCNLHPYYPSICVFRLSVCIAMLVAIRVLAKSPELCSGPGVVGSLCSIDRGLPSLPSQTRLTVAVCCSYRRHSAVAVSTPWHVFGIQHLDLRCTEYTLSDSLFC